MFTCKFWLNHCSMSQRFQSLIHLNTMIVNVIVDIRQESQNFSCKIINTVWFSSLAATYNFLKENMKLQKIATGKTVLKYSSQLVSKPMKSLSYAEAHILEYSGININSIFSADIWRNADIIPNDIFFTVVIVFGFRNVERSYGL